MVGIEPNTKGATSVSQQMYLSQILPLPVGLHGHIRYKLDINAFISLRLLGNLYEINHFTIALSDTEYILAIDTIGLVRNNSIILSLVGRSAFL